MASNVKQRLSEISPSSRADMRSYANKCDALVSASQHTAHRTSGSIIQVTGEEMKLWTGDILYRGVVMIGAIVKPGLPSEVG